MQFKLVAPCHHENTKKISTLNDEIFSIARAFENSDFGRNVANFFSWILMILYSYFEELKSDRNHVYGFAL